MSDDAFRERLTPRLRLTRMRRDHTVAFATYRAHPDVARYQSWESFSEKRATDFIAEMEHRHPDEPGRWFQIAIEERATGALVGDCAMGVDATDPRLAEIGFTTAPLYQRRGFGAEAASALLTYAFEERDKHRITATTDVLNEGSIALLEKLGFRREAHFHENIHFKGRWGDEYVYALLRRDWTPIRASGDDG